MLIFNVFQYIPRRKQTFETLEKRIFTQTILDHFEIPLSMSFYPFSEKKNCDKYSIITYFGSFLYLLFYYLQKTPKKIWMRMQKSIHMYCQGPILNHDDYWPILGQSTRNLIIEVVMFNQDTPWKNMFFTWSKDVVTIKN